MWADLIFIDGSNICKVVFQAQNPSAENPASPFCRIPSCVAWCFFLQSFTTFFKYSLSLSSQCYSKSLCSSLFPTQSYRSFSHNAICSLTDPLALQCPTEFLHVYASPCYGSPLNGKLRELVGNLWQWNTSRSYTEAFHVNVRHFSADICECSRTQRVEKEGRADEKRGAVSERETERDWDEWPNLKASQKYLHTFISEMCVRLKCSTVSWPALCVCVRDVSWARAGAATIVKNANLHSRSVISLLLSPCCLLPARAVGDLDFLYNISHTS